MNEELKKLSLRLNLNRLALNISKTNFVIFRSCGRIADHNVTLILNRKALQQSEYVKYLGVLLDEHLNTYGTVNSISGIIREELNTKLEEVKVISLILNAKRH